jgi:uncharacterized Fe-S cluster-containing radical SAM superfamily protein
MTINEKFLDNNKSFCILPFTELNAANGVATVCCQSFTPVVQLEKFTDWQTDPNYIDIREKMIKGEMLPDHCSACYKRESAGLPSLRIQRTMIEVDSYNLNSLSKLAEIKTPFSYEVRASDTCNLQCRMCYPQNSHLMKREYKKLGLMTSSQRSTRISFDIVDLDTAQQVSVLGGEPTIHKEFIEFLKKCIKQNRTDLDIRISTNAVRLTTELRQLVKQFNNISFTVSIDGYQDINYYIRWPSIWKDIQKNIQNLINDGHKVGFTTTLSIYNVSNCYTLLEFLDKTYPTAACYLELAHSPENKLSAFNFPDNELVLENLTKVKKLRLYTNSKYKIDGLIY